MRRDNLGTLLLDLRNRGNGSMFTLLMREKKDGVLIAPPAPQLLDIKRAAPMPPAPDVNALKFGDPIELFNGRTLDGWRLTDPQDVSGWSAKDGFLTNEPKLEPKLDVGPPRRSSATSAPTASLRTSASRWTCACPSAATAAFIYAAATKCRSRMRSDSNPRAA